MARRRRITAKTRAASRRNLVKARAKRHRRALGFAAGVAAVTTAGVVARHQLSGSELKFTAGSSTSSLTGNKLKSGVHRTRGGYRVTAGKRTVRATYTHRKMKIDSSPLAVVHRRPASSIEKRRMNRFNVAHTPSQKGHSAQRGMQARHGAIRISEFEAQRRTNSYMDSRRRKGSAAAQLRRRNRALNYYRNQPRYDNSASKGTRSNRRRNMGR